MAVSPIRSSLYRRTRWAVILGLLALSITHVTSAQLARKAKETKGPRALGMVEISADGKARLIPIAIVVDGRFYDAGAYKASPVPLALWNETVYEAEKTGVPQGLFTVTDAMRTGSDNWFAEGKWRAAGSEPKKRHSDAKPKQDDDEGPPKLRRPQQDKQSPASTPPAATAPPTSPTADKKSSPPPTTSSPAPTVGAPSADKSSEEKPPDDATATASNDEDPNRPVLKRGKTETLGAAHPEVGASTGVARRPTGAAAKTETSKTPTRRIPAISDAGGPEPRPYLYDLKPDEELKYRKGMLALAADALQAQVKETMPVLPGSKPSTRTPSARTVTKKSQPTFEDVQFRAFDLWNTNEPVFVLSATAHLPKSSGASAEASDDLSYYITLVAKKNIYDELRKLYAGVTDPRHLDQTPRLELVDAVDADGDGRGELLFRQISDVGSAWGIYRAGADQLFPLFEGSPSGR
jgi:hypothetical protein